MNGGLSDAGLFRPSALLTMRFTKNDLDERRSRIQTLQAAHELVFFHRIIRNFRSLRANRVPLRGAGMG